MGIVSKLKWDMHFPGFLDVKENNVLPKDGVVEFIYPFYSEEKAQFYFDSLIHLVAWKQEEMMMYERMVYLPRLIARFGKEETWPDVLLEMKKDMEAHTGLKFNTVLLNLYRDQHDHVSWHADRERDKGDTDFIVSMSLGETRKFQLRHKTDQSIPVITLNLKPGSLVIMKGGMQKNWLHRIAKSTTPKGPRINLTFRILQCNK